MDPTATAAKSVGKEIEAAAFLASALAVIGAEARAAAAAAVVKVTTAGGDTATSGSLNCARHGPWASGRWVVSAP